MGFKHMLKAVAPVVALAIAGSLAGCDKASVNFNGEEGKPLADLDLSGEAPSEVNLLGPDTVDIRDGEKLAIQVEGNDEAKDRMRFVLKNGSLGILRQNGSWSDNQTATVIVTMPAPAMKPIIDVAVKKAPIAACAGRMPTSENGIGAMISSGVLNDWNQPTTSR